MTGVAIIGQGYMAHTHAQAWRELGFARDILYVVAPQPRYEPEMAPEAEFTSDLETALSDERVTVVSVCTPTPSHMSIATRAIRAGKHVLLEKPIALTLPDAEHIASVAKNSDRIVMVAQVVRFFGGYRAIHEVAKAGTLGPLVSFRASRALAQPDWAPWWSDESISGGVPVDFAVHDYDQANLFMGEPKRVLARQIKLEGPIEATIDYADGGLAQILSYPYLPQGSAFSSSIELVGTEGTASYRMLSAGAPTDSAEEGQSELSVAVSGAVHRSQIENDSPYRDEVAYFIRCVDGRRPPVRSPIDSAVSALRVALGVRRSLESGRAVDL